MGSLVGGIMQKGVESLLRTAGVGRGKVRAHVKLRRRRQQRTKRKLDGSDRIWTPEFSSGWQFESGSDANFSPRADLQVKVVSVTGGKALSDSRHGD